MDFKTLFTLEGLLGIGQFLIKPIIIFIICRVFAKVFSKIAENVLEKSKLDGGIKSFSKSAMRIILWIFTIILVADSVGVNTTSLVAVLSVVSLALSLSVQNIMTNAFSGITLLLSKPFIVGDFVQVAGVSGTVKSIKLMRTTLVTPDNKRELIPNGDICATTITNFSTEKIRRVELFVSASYNAPTDTVKKAVMDVIQPEIDKGRIITEEGKEPFVRLNKYNAHDIEYVIRVWVNSPDYWSVYFDMNENIRESFAKNNVEFTYPHIIIEK